MDIDKIEDLYNLKLSKTSKENISFICEKCGHRSSRKYFSLIGKHNKLWCTKCLKKSVKRDLTKATQAAASKKARDKAANTLFKKTGRKSNFDQSFKELKIKEKYGVTNAYQIKEIKEKSLKTRQLKKEIRIKKEQEENLIIFGTKFPTRKQKQQKTCQDKYKIDNPFQLQKVKEATILRNKESHQIKLLQFSKDQNLQILTNTENKIELRCNKCGTNFELKHLKNGTGWYYDYCPTCYPDRYNYEEKQVLEFIKSIYKDEIIENDRTVLNGKEIDIYLPKLKFGIEYNGLYWHANDKRRHREKWELAQKAQIDLMQIWSSEWKLKRSILESIIKNRLGLSIPIYARECEIKFVNSKEARLFADTYHMQGFYAGVYIGLYYKGELVDLSIFCKCRFGKKYDYELTRHCIKSGIRVIGGLSREISFFRKNGYQGTIVDYCDMRLFNGKGHWGFKEIGMTPPDMQYTDYKQIIPRGKYQKHKMSKITGFNFDSKLTQLQNLHNNGLDFIFGVGHKVFLN